MKADIHPDYVETEVTCTCGNTFTTRSTAKNGVIHADVCSNCHPFYTGKQKILDTGGRVARFEARYAKKASDKKDAEQAPRRPTPTTSFPAAPTRALVGVGRRLRFRMAGRVRREEERCSRPSTRWRAEHAELERRLGAPETHADARLAKRLNQRYAHLSRVLAAKKEWDDLGGDIEAARELAAEDPTFADEVETLIDAPARRRGAAAAAAGPARPDRRQGRHPRGEVGGGRRGVRAVRRRPAPHVLPVRRAAGLEGRDPRRHRVRPRRLQVGHPRGEGEGRPPSRARRRTAC